MGRISADQIREGARVDWRRILAWSDGRIPIVQLGEANWIAIAPAGDQQVSELAPCAEVMPEKPAAEAKANGCPN